MSWTGSGFHWFGRTPLPKSLLSTPPPSFEARVTFLSQRLVITPMHYPVQLLVDNPELSPVVHVLPFLRCSCWNQDGPEAATARVHQTRARLGQLAECGVLRVLGGEFPHLSDQPPPRFPSHRPSSTPPLPSPISPFLSSSYSSYYHPTIYQPSILSAIYLSGK